MASETPRKMSDWQPMRNPKDIAVLGKLIEEVGELAAALSRCLIQGIDESEPVTGKPNRLWLAEEIADVRALARLTEEHFDLAVSNARMSRKYREKTAWLKLVKPRRTR